VPENALKFAVGVLISTFGMFWIGEGFGFSWPGADWSIPAMILCLLAGSLTAVALVKARALRRRLPA
jgi:uncharacterized membrane protein